MIWGNIEEEWTIYCAHKFRNKISFPLLFDAKISRTATKDEYKRMK
jgi:hypothetical protein